MRGGGIVLAAAAISHQLMAEPENPAAQSLSQPFGCQLPLHKGAFNLSLWERLNLKNASSSLMPGTRTHFYISFLTP